MHGDIFYPTACSGCCCRPTPGMTWGFIIHIFLAGCFTYGFLRAWGFGFFPSLIGGIAYMLSGELAGLVSPGHDGKLFVSALHAADALVPRARHSRRAAVGVGRCSRSRSAWPS